MNKINKNTNEGYFFYTCCDKMSDRDYLRKEGRKEGGREGRKEGRLMATGNSCLPSLL